MVILGRGGGSILPGDICGYSIGLVDICGQFLAQDGGLDCLCNSIAESLGKEMAGRENNKRSIENVVLSHSFAFKESSTSSHAVDKFRLRSDFELFLRQTKL